MTRKHKTEPRPSGSGHHMLPLPPGEGRGEGVGRSSHSSESCATFRKRGSVLVLAVAVLAVLAALAVSYVTVVRVDRRSTNAYQKQENLQQQVGVVTAYLQSLISADLYGNRIVNSATPRLFQNNPDLPNWPKAFEDGEYMDVPWTDAGQTALGLSSPGYTWDTQSLPFNQQPSNNALLRPTLGERSFADDAWLAPIEPIDTGFNPIGEWDTWAQITNLRSAYRYNDDLSLQSGLPVWVRDDGRFVDLAQFLLQDPPNFTSGVRPGYPGADLTLNSNQSGLWADPTSNNQPNGPNLGVSQRIFDLQMADLQEEFYWPPSAPNAPQQGLREFLPADERFWADTDGDGRPDARWQELDLLGNAFGLRWVVAARIIDNSALANVNSHITFGFPDGSNFAGDELYGDGRTPADVDLFRLIASQINNAQGFNPATGAVDFTAHPDIRVGGNLLNYNQGPQVDSALDRSWQIFMNRGVRAPSILDQLKTLNTSSGPGDPPLALGQPNGFLNNWPGGQLYGDSDANPNPDLIQALDLKRFERAHIWRYFGSNPFNPFATSGLAFPLRDEIDLRAYSGFNLLSYVSRLEQRIDGGAGNNNLGFLPGSQPQYSDFINGPGLGFLRAKEWDLISESPRTFGNFFALQPQPGQYTNQAKLERLRKDIRHLLTTISGEGPIGPVPVLNPADEFDRVYRTRKVDLNRFTTPDLTVDPARIREPLEDAFEAFVWALAPLATNQPLMSPLEQIDPTAYAQLARDADLHYGGGMNGPASAVASLYGLSPNTNGGPDPMGASYAVLRAASLAVNLTDAIDGETQPDTSTATTEAPTIVRFFNQPDLNLFFGSNPTARDSVANINAIPLGARLPQGDITGDLLSFPPSPDLSALPEEVVGPADSGVTLVGLDRQPFLVQATTVVLYANTNANENANVDTDTEIDPNDPTDILGSFFAVELGNPWPEPLDLAGYVVRISDGAMPQNVIELDLTGGTFTDSTGASTAGALIPAGDRVVFYYFSDVSPGASAGGAAAWDQAKDELLMEFVNNGPLGDGGNVRLIQSGLGGSALATGLTDIYQPFAGGSFPVLLTRRLNVTVGGTPTAVDLLVDRLTPPNGEPFPATLDGIISANDLIAGGGPSGVGTVNSAAIRAAVQTSLRRPTDPGSLGGYPLYVIEHAGNNAARVQSRTIDQVSHAWIFDADTGSPINPLPLTDITNQINMLGELQLLADVKPNDGAAPREPGAFELFVPNGPLFAVSELGQISAFAHMYIHADQQLPSIANAWDSTGQLGPGKWATVSEQLGWGAHMSYDAQTMSVPNPYFGVLDFSRFILGVGGDMDTVATVVGPLLPDALAVPLATRVFDAFEALPTPDGVARGRVNVNTAPRKVLELLPMVDPRDPFTGAPLTNIGGWDPSSLMFAAQSMGDLRTDWLERYRRRDMDVPGTGLNNASNDALPDFDSAARQRLDGYTLLSGLRYPGTQAPWSTGLVSKGEIASMALWDADGQPNSTSPVFLELAANSTINDQQPLDIRPLTTGFEAQDDPEERLALFRAISNIVSTRSDIYTAWFIIRAYDPKDIEAIQVPPDIQFDDDAVASLMNPGNPLGLDGVSEDNPGLLPAFERRVLVIFDRSNVQRPSDRPEVLLQIELPLN